MFDQIFITTVNRVHQQTTYNCLPESLKKQVTFVVQSWEREQYHYDAEYLVLPEEIDFKKPYAIDLTRRWVFEHAKNMKYFMLDDDIKFYRRNAKYWTGKSNMVQSKRLCTDSDIIDMFSTYEKCLSEPTIAICGCAQSENPPSNKEFRYNTSISSAFWIDGKKFAHELPFELPLFKVREDAAFLLHLMTLGYRNCISQEFATYNESVRKQSSLPSDIWNNLSATDAYTEALKMEKHFPNIFQIVYESDGKQMAGGFRDTGKTRISWSRAFKPKTKPIETLNQKSDRKDEPHTQSRLVEKDTLRNEQDSIITSERRMPDYDDCVKILEQAILEASEALEKPKKTSKERDFLIVHLRNEKDANTFARAIKTQLHEDQQKEPILFDPRSKVSETKWSFVPSKGTSKRSASKKKTELDKQAEKHWTGTVPFKNEPISDFATFRLQFLSIDDVRYFIKHVIKAPLSPETKSIYFPVRERDDLISKAWVATNKTLTKPRYPIYVVSKGRWGERTTVKTLDAMGVDYLVAIEEQQYFEYSTYIDKKKLFVLPFAGDHGFGPGPARKSCWDHAAANGHKKHWVLDDNIDGFYRLHENKRIRVADGSIFRAAEDFIDRYDNIYVSGFQYRFFASPGQKQRPFVLNTRIYSCLLIDHRCPHRWRGKYNEDTILALDLLKNGYPTLQFTAFLQGKLATQTQGGGNTEEFYSKDEGTTLPKSQMLVAVHPKYSKLVMKYGRPHHQVDYKSFKDIALKSKQGVTIPTEDPFEWTLTET